MRDPAVLGPYHVPLISGNSRVMDSGVVLVCMVRQMYN